MKTQLILSALLLAASTAAFAYENTPISTLITVVKNHEGEKLVADAAGKTLYVFDHDQNKPAPVCNGDCAEVWPPYLLSAEEMANLKAPLGSIQRVNQKPQLTYEGRPVYTFAFDRKSGDDKGDGLGNVWHYIELE